MAASIGSEISVPLSLSPQGTALLNNLEAARDLLARGLVSEFHAITDPDLNYTILSSILQAFFIRTIQECGFIERDTLAVLAGCDGIAGRMARVCSDTGFSPDTLLETGQRGFHVFPSTPDKPLREILTRMNGPDIPVPIVQLPLEELACVLEHFLGTRMQAAGGCRVKRVGKSAMLYNGGIETLSQDVINHMVHATVGELTENSELNKRPAGKILDPACGAGLFLLTVFRFLARNETLSHNRQGQIRDVPRDIICSSVFGTDIDPESVSAARLVLLLAFIEENQRSGSGLQSPDQISGICACLIKSIRCGNALIGPDYFSGKPVFPFNADERWKVNPFDWQEAFPEVVASGGFDTIIGAPPLYRPFVITAREEYFQTHYNTYAPSAGLYGYFIERGLSLLRPGGTLAYLVPGTFLRSQHARPLRRHLLSYQIEQITSTGRTRSLQEGTSPEYALFLRNEPPSRRVFISMGWGVTGSLQNSYGAGNFMLNQRSLNDGGWNLEDTREADLLKKILGEGIPLDDLILGQIDAGTHRIRKNPLVVDPETRNRLTKREWWCRRNFIPLLRPADIQRYMPVKPTRFIISIKNYKDLRKCRALYGYLESVAKEIASDRGPENSRNGTGLSAENFTICPGLEQFVPKIIFSPYQKRPAFCYDSHGSYAITNTLLAIPRNDPFLAAVLNSTLGRFIITHICPLTDRGFHVSSAALVKFPIMTPDLDKLADKTRYGKIMSLVDQLLSLQDYLEKAKTDQERRLVQQEIDATDVRIDALVYELYGLTPDEIALIEETNSGRSIIRREKERMPLKRS